MIFAVPMRILPRVNIIFKDKSLTFDIIESMRSRVSTALKVRRGTNGIKHMVDIELVELDAKL